MAAVVACTPVGAWGTTACGVAVTGSDTGLAPSSLLASRWKVTAWPFGSPATVYVVAWASPVALAGISCHVVPPSVV